MTDSLKKDLRNRPDRVHIVYFTGTGGTRRAAQTFQRMFNACEIGATLQELNRARLSPAIDQAALAQADLLMLLYPVHAFNAPAPVYEYIASLPVSDKKLTAVISVSGGGDGLSNSACRCHCIRKLHRRGYRVFYENMLVMPNNWAAPMPQELAIRLLEVLPNKVEEMAADIAAGHGRRTRPPLRGRILSQLGELAKSAFGFSFLGKRLRANDSCNGCSWCADACPSGNIRMQEDRPAFGNRCLLCMRCIYGCPQTAIHPGIGKFMELPDGYSLEQIEHMLEEGRPAETAEVSGSRSWEGVAAYLSAGRSGRNL